MAANEQRKRKPRHTVALSPEEHARIDMTARIWASDPETDFRIDGRYPPVPQFLRFLALQAVGDRRLA